MRPLLPESFNKSPLLTLGAILLSLGLSSCGEKEIAVKNKVAQKEAVKQKIRPFFEPLDGERWDYEFWDESATGQRTSRRLKTLICKGTVNHPSDLDYCFRFDIVEGKRRTGSDYWIIAPEGIYSAGFLSARTDSISWLSRPFPILLYGSTAGDVWSGGSKKLEHLQFRNLGQETITVPAGRYDTTRVQMNQKKDGRIKRHDMWIAKGIGLIKEEWLITKKEGEPRKRIKVLKKKHLRNKE